MLVTGGSLRMATKGTSLSSSLRTLVAGFRTLVINTQYSRAATPRARLSTITSKSPTTSDLNPSANAASPSTTSSASASTSTPPPSKKPKSGLQKEICSLYRRGLRNVLSKPEDAQDNFLLHLRYGFHHPKLGPRDYGAIEHQIRRFTKQLETLSESSVRKISVNQEMRDWWRGEVERVRAGV